MSPSNYEIVSELHHTGLTAVYAVRNRNNPQNLLTMKVFEAEHLAEHETKHYFDQVISSIQVQQKAASLPDSYWAAIYDFGIDEKPFYVTDQYTNSLQNVLEGKIKVHPNTLYQIILSILAGLQELKTSCHRPHGNLKPSNILLKGAPATNDFKVSLTDPLADTLVRDHHWQSDLHFVCQMIYQLVTGQSVPEIPSWRIQKDEHWKYLGKLANGWIDVGNTLLTVSSEGQAADIENLIKKLPIKKSNKPLIYSTLSCLCLFCLVGFSIWGYGWYKQKKIDDAAPEPSRWKILMASYYQPWGRDFAEEIQKRKQDSAFQQKWESAGLGYLLKQETLDLITYPVRVAENAKYDVREYEVWGQKENLYLSATTKETQITLDAYSRITALFDLSGKESWKYLSDIQIHKESLALWRCETSLEQLLASVKPQNPRFISNIDTIIAIYQPLAECVKAYQDLHDTMDPRLDAALNDKIANILNNGFTPQVFKEIHSTLLMPTKDILAVEKEALEEKENQQAVEIILNNLVARLPLDGAQAIHDASIELEKLIITWDKLEDDILKTRPQDAGALSLWKEWKARFDVYKKDKVKDREWLKTAKGGYEAFQGNISSLEESIKNPANTTLASSGPTWQGLYSALFQARQNAIEEDIRKSIQLDFLGSAKTVKEKEAELLGYLTDLKDRLKIISDIEVSLANCYLSNEKTGLDSGKSIASLRDDFIKGVSPELRTKPEVEKVLNDTDKLSAIERTQSLQELLTILTAQSGNLPPVCRYSAWQRLGQLEEGWQWKDKQEMLKAHDTLKQEVKDHITENQRKEAVLSNIEIIAAGQLKKYLNQQTAGLNEILGQLKEPDESFTSLILEPCREDIKNRVKTFREAFDAASDVSTLNTELDTNWTTIDSESRLIISKITSLINSENWKAANCLKKLFSEDMKRDWEKTKQWSSAFLENWIQKIPLYHTISDSRNDIIAKDIADRIESEAEPQEKEGIQKELDALSAEIIASQAEFPAIQKYAEDIAKQVDRFKGRYDGIDQKLTPKWCGFLTWDDVSGKIIFKNNILPDFEPVILVKGNDSDSFSNKEWDKISNRDNWRQIRKNRDPFFSAEGFNEKQSSWPKYIRSTKDSSVICRFIPEDNTKGIKPFYIGIQEVTFRQVPETERRKYYERKPYSPPRWPGYGNVSDKLDYPFVYITAKNAEACARLFGGQLPTPAEHLYVRDWVNGNEDVFHLTDDSTLAKVIRTYNYYSVSGASTKGNFWETGVILMKEKNNEEKNESIYKSCFPQKSDKSDLKGLYDIEGNVWEWCKINESSVICGYSSLTPKGFRENKIHYSLENTGLETGLEGEYSWDVDPEKAYCDVGFRIVVKIPDTP